MESRISCHGLFPSRAIIVSATACMARTRSQANARWRAGSAATVSSRPAPSSSPPPPAWRARALRLAQTGTLDNGYQNLGAMGPPHPRPHLHLCPRLHVHGAAGVTEPVEYSRDAPALLCFALCWYDLPGHLHSQACSNGSRQVNSQHAGTGALHAQAPMHDQPPLLSI